MGNLVTIDHHGWYLELELLSQFKAVETLNEGGSHFLTMSSSTRRAARKEPLRPPPSSARRAMPSSPRSVSSASTVDLGSIRDDVGDAVAGQFDQTAIGHAHSE